MEDTVYDVPIGEVASMLDKSDRQVRRYVKGQRLRAQPVRINGHMKLMFNRGQVIEFRERSLAQAIIEDSRGQILVDAQLVGDTTSFEGDGAAHAEGAEQGAVKYVVDALREQITALRDENRELHYQLEQRSGQVGFLQGKVESLQEEVKMLAPAPKPEPTVDDRPWWRFW